MDNYECMGYVILAMQKQGASEEEISKMIYALKTSFDGTTETEAGQVYDKFMGLI